MDAKWDELKRLAEAATPGPWWIDSHGSCMISEKTLDVIFIHQDSGEAVRHADTGNLSHWRNDWDASYIAAANPAAVLELIAQLEQKQRECEELRTLLLDAAEEIDTWGAYASEYFQEKHNLRGTVEKFHAAAEIHRRI